MRTPRSDETRSLRAAARNKYRACTTFPPGSPIHEAARSFAGGNELNGRWDEHLEGTFWGSLRAIDRMGDFRRGWTDAVRHHFPEATSLRPEGEVRRREDLKPGESFYFVDPAKPCLVLDDRSLDRRFGRRYWGGSFKLWHVCTWSGEVSWASPTTEVHTYSRRES